MISSLKRSFPGSNQEISGHHPKLTEDIATLQLQPLNRRSICFCIITLLSHFTG